MIIRGTTPTLTAKLPIKCEAIDACSVTFAQNHDEVVFEKTLADCVPKDDTLYLTLTEEDTLSFKCRKNVYIQFTIACGSIRYKSDILVEPVGPSLRNGCMEVGTVAPSSFSPEALAPVIEVGLNEL